MNIREETVAWAMAIVQKAMAEGAYGRVSIILEAGRIVRAQVETSERPPVQTSLETRKIAVA